jgi:DNA-binding CsgD family transcriptional regulator
MDKELSTHYDKAEEIRDVPVLSRRQQDCLSGVLNLKSAKEIARDLGISPHAVEKHLKVCRQKLGVSTSAEAARLFALIRNGGESSHYGPSDLASAGLTEHQVPVLGRHERTAFGCLEGKDGAPLAHRPLTPRQTLLAIAAVSLGSIVGLLLLVACAEGIRSLVLR